MLTERQLFLLQVLVNDYILSAEPVGSRSIAKRDDVHYSPATIRNELADLEEMGYLEKTHLSSGRVPSEKGYRFYVDHLLSPVMLSDDEMRGIRQAFRQEFVETEKLIQTTAELLSDFTNYTAIMLGPELLDTRLKHLEMIRLSERQGVMIIVTDTGHVENRVVSFPSGIKPGEIEKIVNILNEKLNKVPLYQLRNRLQEEVGKVLRQHVSHFEKIMSLLQESLTIDDPEKIFFSGKNKILAQPEFQNVDKIIPLLNVFEGKAIIHELLSLPAEGLHIRIGTENKRLGITDCSLITTTYSVDGEHVGTVAVIGPKRMAYPRVVTLIDLLSKILTKNLTERESRK
ncbi:heat-inducible transcriptional repressor HrcA [Sporolactobacillus sp. THM7-7]|nr:heat-inducible transcriptional repressor HrcA [Sporolactobacillus sp. THM7-7]